MMNIQPLTIADRVPWADLLAQAFDRTPLQMQDLLDWLTRHYQLIVWGIWDGSHLAAQYSLLIREVFDPADGEYVKIGLSMNMAVHKDYRGRGLIKQLAVPVYETLYEQGGIAGVGFSNAEGVQVDRHSKGYGYQVIGRMRSTLAWIKPSRTDPLTLSDRLPTLPICPPVSNPQQIQFRSTPDLLYSRFAAHPFRQYRYGIWQTDHAVQGIVVYRPVTLNGRPGAALLAAYTEHQSMLPHLLAKWSAALRDAGISAVHLLSSPRSAVRSALQHSAICMPLPISRTPHYLTVKPLTLATPTSLLNFSAWDCLGGDIL